MDKLFVLMNKDFFGLITCYYFFARTSCTCKRIRICSGESKLVKTNGLFVQTNCLFLQPICDLFWRKRNCFLNDFQFRRTKICLEKLRYIQTNKLFDNINTCNLFVRANQDFVQTKGFARKKADFFRRTTFFFGRIKFFLDKLDICLDKQLICSNELGFLH